MAGIISSGSPSSATRFATKACKSDRRQATGAHEQSTSAEAMASRSLQYSHGCAGAHPRSQLTAWIHVPGHPQLVPGPLVQQLQLDRDQGVHRPAPFHRSHQVLIVLVRDGIWVRQRSRYRRCSRHGTAQARPVPCRAVPCALTIWAVASRRWRRQHLPPQLTGCVCSPRPAAAGGLSHSVGPSHSLRACS